jgi:hypothetical protein
MYTNIVGRGESTTEIFPVAFTGGDVLSCPLVFSRFLCTPIVYRLGHEVFILKSGVRFPVGVPFSSHVEFIFKSALTRRGR